MTYDYDTNDFEYLQEVYAAIECDCFQWPLTAGETYALSLTTNETTTD